MWASQLLSLLALAAWLRAGYEAARLPGREASVKLTGPGKSSTLEPEPANPPRQGRRGLTAEEQRFRELPPQLQRQLLRYGSRWSEAIFEPKP